MNAGVGRWPGGCLVDKRVPALAQASILIQTASMTMKENIEPCTPDLRQELVDRLKAAAPEAFTDGAINLDRLAELVGLPVDSGPERYGLWDLD